MLHAQNHCCGVCGKPFTAAKRPYIEHNHQTGKVRSLAHQRCNIAVAHVEGALLTDCLAYLAKHRNGV